MRYCVIAATLTSLAFARLEPVTRIEFADERASQPLVGLGVRRKGHFNVKVYAVGLYADRIGSQLALLQHKEDQLPAELTQKFFDAILLGGFAKTLVIKMASTVTREKIAAALVESVKPRMGSGGRDLDAFQQILLNGCAAHATGGQPCTETEFAIGLRGPSIGVSVNGMGAGAISSARLSRALLECFLDEETVSPTLKESCGEGFLAMLA